MPVDIPVDTPVGEVGSRGVDTFVTVLKNRVKAVDDLLVEKERLQLSYVFSKVPRPFYVRWKEEANSVFSLRVTLKRRRFRA